MISHALLDHCAVDNVNIMTSSFQLLISAHDTTYPKNKAIKYVTIAVNRNANAPTFERDTYEKTVTATYPLVTEVLKTKANDQDGVRGYI